ncbi:MAG TPA: hypothetical protein VMS96_04080 [Terriglobales bacterium]|nr:hypothetical protein [Terriglobales bacterium]
MSRLRSLVLIAAMFAFSLPAFAQQPQAPDAPSAAKKPPASHRFWDKTNVLLFAGVTGARYLDYGSTIWMRNRGVDEWLLSNDIVDNHAAFAAIEFAGAAASVGISYALHKTGHHTLERVVSVVHIGVATGGAIRNFTLP